SRLHPPARARCAGSFLIPTAAGAMPAASPDLPCQLKAALSAVRLICAARRAWLQQLAARCAQRLQGLQGSQCPSSLPPPKLPTRAYCLRGASGPAPRETLPVFPQLRYDAIPQVAVVCPSVFAAVRLCRPPPLLSPVSIAR